MRRGVGLLPGGQVAQRVAAIVERDLQLVIATDMALLACHAGVRVGQREIDGRPTVVDPCSRPTRRGMTGGTLRYRECSWVRGVRRRVSLIVGCQMALRVSAIVERDLQLVIATDMALLACHVGMSLCQREINGRRSMVDPRCQPACRRVASGTLCYRKCSRVRCVRGIIGLLPSGQMALRVPAIVELDVQVVVAADMALLTRHAGMALYERKINRRSSMIKVPTRSRKRRVQPSVKALMTRLALARRE